MLKNRHLSGTKCQFFLIVKYLDLNLSVRIILKFVETETNFNKYKFRIYLYKI